jgi:Holliday junction DNA helicase RuvB
MQSPLDIIDAQSMVDDSAASFNPRTFEEYLGQAVIKEKLKVYTHASRQRNEPLDHLLLFGPPGLGKTTLAKVMAHELGVPIKITSAPVLERSGDLVALLSNLAPKDILFIDEIHRLPKHVEEILYSAMENFCVDMIVGSGAGAQSIRLPLNPFTLIGATTKTALISGPLQTRFGIIERLDFYTPEELAQIVKQNSSFFETIFSEEAALMIGTAARGTPRIVKRLFRRVRDFAQFYQHTLVSAEIADQALQFLGIDQHGLNPLDRQVLIHLIKDFDGGPVGLETLAAMTGEDKETLEEYCEPFLIRRGFLQKTSRGRIIPAQRVRFLRALLLGEKIEAQDTLFD